MGIDAPAIAEFSLIAGHPALDLCNTVDWRLEPDSRYERLTSYDAALAWARAAGVLTPGEAVAVAALPALVETGASAARSSGPGRRSQRAGSAAERELGLLRDLRETTYRLVTERHAADARALSTMAADAVRACRLTPADGRWDWTEPAVTLATPRRRVVLALVDLLRSPAVADVRRCADGSCGWVYLDTSPRKNRLWCVAGDCGNRNRVRRHYQRRRALTTS